MGFVGLGYFLMDWGQMWNSSNKYGAIAHFKRTSKKIKFVAIHLKHMKQKQYAMLWLIPSLDIILYWLYVCIILNISGFTTLKIWTFGTCNATYSVITAKCGRILVTTLPPTSAPTTPARAPTTAPPNCYYNIKGSDLGDDKLRHFGGGVTAEKTDDGAVTFKFPENVILSVIEAQTTTGSFLTVLPISESGAIIAKPIVSLLYLRELNICDILHLMNHFIQNPYTFWDLFLRQLYGHLISQRWGFLVCLPGP